MQMYLKMRLGFRIGRMNLQRFRDTRSRQVQFVGSYLQHFCLLFSFSPMDDGSAQHQMFLGREK